MLSRINFLLLNITNLLFVMFVILQSKKNFLFLLVHLKLQEKRELHTDQNSYVKSILYTKFYIQIKFRM